MVCPVCLAAAITANAPALAAAVSGVAAIKVAFNKRDPPKSKKQSPRAESCATERVPAAAKRRSEVRAAPFKPSMVRRGEQEQECQ